jgi:hypothetical protein
MSDIAQELLDEVKRIFLRLRAVRGRMRPRTKLIIKWGTPFPNLLYYILQAAAVLWKPKEQCRTSQTHYKHHTKNSVQGTTYYKWGEAT